VDDRRTATLIGLFFLVATGFYLAGQGLYGGIISGGGIAPLTSAQQTRIVGGVLVELLGVLAIPMIAVFLYPVLRRFSAPLALAYVALRVIEAALLAVVAALTLSLLAELTILDWAELRELIALLSEPPFLLSVGFAFPLSAMILNSVLWRTRLVPRGISAWGLLAGLLLFAGSVANLFGLLDSMPPGAAEALVSGPIALQEIVLAVWLIARGFLSDGLRALPQDGSAGRT
jgi:hypothetical protein